MFFYDFISLSNRFYGLHTNLIIKVTLQFIMIFSKNFMTFTHVQVKNGFGGQIGYQRNIETGMKEPLVKLWKNYQIIMLMIRVSVI